MDKNKIAAHLAKQVASAQAAAPADLEALKARALAATLNDFDRGTSLTPEFLAFMDEATPAVVLALIDRIARAEAPKRPMSPEIKVAIEHAHKTGATSAVAATGEAVFINYGHDLGDNAHLECTACGGSGHIEDQKAISATKPALEALRVGQQAVPSTDLKDAFAQALHYPDCWDTAVYPALSDALAAVYEHFKCSQCAQEKAAPAEQADSSHVMPPVAAPASQHGAPASEWIKVDESVPSGRNCLAVYENRGGSQFIIRAMYVDKFQIEAQGDDCDTEINDENDTEYLRAGWYELIDNWGEYSSVKVCEGEVTHWMPLPLKPGESAASGFREGRNTNDNDSAESVSSGAPSAEDVRDAALEEAAQIALKERDEFQPKSALNNGRESDFAFGSVNSAERICSAVRALKSAGRGSDDVREGAAS